MKAKQLYAALLRKGWTLKRVAGSHKILQRPGWPDYLFAFHDSDEVGRKLVARTAKEAGLTPEDL